MISRPTPDIALLRQLAAKAKPQPWKVFNLLRGAYEICRADDYATGGVCVPHRKDDADYIVVAVNALPALLDRIQRDEAALRVVRAAHGAHQLEHSTAADRCGIVLFYDSEMEALKALDVLAQGGE